PSARWRVTCSGTPPNVTRVWLFADAARCERRPLRPLEPERHPAAEAPERRSEIDTHMVVHPLAMSLASVEPYPQQDDPRYQHPHAVHRADCVADDQSAALLRGRVVAESRRQGFAARLLEDIKEGNRRGRR